MICSNCGKFVEDGYFFCTNCGRKMEEKTEAAVHTDIESVHTEQQPVQTEEQTVHTDETPSGIYEKAMQTEGGSDSAPVVPQLRQRGEKLYFGKGALIFCLAAIGMLAVSTGVFAGLYFSVV